MELKRRISTIGGESGPDGRDIYAWYVVILFACFYMLSFVDRLIVGLLVEPIKADLGLSDTQISLVHGFSFALFYTVFGLFMGRLADLFNRRNLIAAGVVTWSLLTILCGAASRYWHLLVLRIGVGIGEATLTPAAYSIISDYFTKARRSTALSVFSAGVYFGIAAAFTGGAYLYRFFESWLDAKGGLTLPFLGDVAAWQLVFVAVGVPGLLLSSLLITVREPIRTSDRRSGDGDSLGPEPFHAVLRYFRRHWRSVLGHNMGIALISAFAYSRDLWNVAFFERTYGWKLYESGPWYGGIVLLAGVLGVYTGGRIADRLAQRKIVTANMLIMLIAVVVGFRLEWPTRSCPLPSCPYCVSFPRYS